MASQFARTGSGIADRSGQSWRRYPIRSDPPKKGDQRAAAAREGGRTVLEVGAVLGGGEVHLDVVEVLALAEVVVVGGGEEARPVPPHDGLQEAVVDVEREHLPPVHPVSLAGRRLRRRRGGGCGESGGPGAARRGSG